MMKINNQSLVRLVIFVIVLRFKLLFRQLEHMVWLEEH